MLLEMVTAQYKKHKKGKRFTTLPLMSLSGDPVMCVIIIEETLQYLFIELGIDVTKLVDNVNIDNVTADEETISTYYIRQNMGPGKLFPGGPMCNSNGKQVPYMVRYTKGGINENSQTCPSLLLHRKQNLRTQNLECQNLA